MNTSSLRHAVDEIERHVSAGGWDQPPRLYALAPTDDLVRREPELADQLGVDPATLPADTLTPVEQRLPDQPLDELLASIAWPDTVAGCVLAVERIVLPPAAEEAMPEDVDAVNDWAQQHPGRTDVRIVVGVLRDGSRSSVMRVRGHEDDTELIRDPEFSPNLGDVLAETLVG